MIKITEINDFDSIYWHDSILMSIEFDVVNDNVLLYIDLNISNLENNISYQPSLLILYNVPDFKIELKWENAGIKPGIAFIERELIDKPRHFTTNLDIYKYLIHFLDPAIGKIEVPLIEDFKLILLTEPIKYENDVDYYKKRFEVIKNYFNNHKE